MHRRTLFLQSRAQSAPPGRPDRDIPYVALEIAPVFDVRRVVEQLKGLSCNDCIEPRQLGLILQQMALLNDPQALIDVFKTQTLVFIPSNHNQIAKYLSSSGQLELLNFFYNVQVLCADFETAREHFGVLYNITECCRDDF